MSFGSRSIGFERDPPAIGGPNAAQIVSSGLGKIGLVTAVRVHRKDVEVSGSLALEKKAAAAGQNPHVEQLTAKAISEVAPTETVAFCELSAAHRAFSGIHSADCDAVGPGGHIRRRSPFPLTPRSGRGSRCRASRCSRLGRARPRRRHADPNGAAGRRAVNREGDLHRTATHHRHCPRVVTLYATVGAAPESRIVCCPAPRLLTLVSCSRADGLAGAPASTTKLKPSVSESPPVVTVVR